MIKNIKNNLFFNAIMMVMTIYVSMGLFTTVEAKDYDDYQLKTWQYQAKDATHGQIIFTVDGSVKYKYFFLQNPNRLVVDFMDTGLGTIGNLSNAIFKTVRGGIPNPHIARVVFELAIPITVENSHQNSKNQVIIDITHHSTTQSSTSQPLIMRQSNLRNINIIIDAGHGGKDPGAIGLQGTREKDIVLAIARELSRLVEHEPGMHVSMTRNSDNYVTLRQRLKRARDQKADVFVAIHADAFKHAHARGSSVYAVSEKGASSEAAKWLADKENYSELAGVNLSNKNDLLRSVLIDLSQTATIHSSLQLGHDVLLQLGGVSQLHHPRVEQAPFVVLKSPDIPSILVETGFLSNPIEEQRLRDPLYQKLVANAIMQGIKKYFYRTPPPGTLIAAIASNNSARG